MCRICGSFGLEDQKWYLDPSTHEEKMFSQADVAISKHFGHRIGNETN